MGMIRRYVTKNRLLLVLVFLVLAMIYRTLQEKGHDWGDDFALYINQARGLVKGDIARIVTDTRFALDNSGASSFSPNVYPWGFPLLLAPVFLVAGINYAAFTWVTTIGLCIFFACYFHLMKVRIGTLGATVLTMVLAFSLPYAGWTASVTSDFASLAVVGIALVWIERCKNRRELFGANRTPLIILGLLIGFAFSIRRETIALMFALAAVHLVEILKAKKESNSEIPWREVLLPYEVAAGFIIVLQLVLPASLILDSTGGGSGVLWSNIKWYGNIFAEQVGLKDIGPNEIALFNNVQLGRVFFNAIIIFFVIGILDSIIRRFSRDASIIMFFLGALWIIGTQPFHEGRYLFSLTPFVVFFAFTGITSVVSFVLQSPISINDPTTNVRSRATIAIALIPSLLSFPLVISNAQDLKNSVEYHRVYEYVIQGPETPSAQELFAAVLKCTRGYDVVLFARARAMNLYTNRKSIQAGNMDIALQRADWLALTKDDVDYYEPKINEANAAEYGVHEVWANGEFVLYRVGDAPSGRAQACPSK